MRKLKGGKTMTSIGNKQEKLDQSKIAVAYEAWKEAIDIAMKAYDAYWEAIKKAKG